MGVWGFKLYENDLALDIRDEFEEQLKKGKNVNEITTQLIEEFDSIMGNSYEEPLFWFALADTQWNWGRLLPYVKEQALIWIEKSEDIGWWREEEPKKQSKRKEMLNELQEKLLSEQSTPKKIVKKRLYRCEWKIGDVFAFQLESERSKERGFYGRYFLIQKVDESTWHPGHIVPIVYVKITKDDKLPASLIEYNQLEYVQTGFTKYEDRFYPINVARIQEDIAEKSKLRYEVDEYGFLPEFRVWLLNTSKRVIPSKLIYIGNYINAVPPQKEFVPHCEYNIRAISWKKDAFETKMLEAYCDHNLRELSVYHKRKS